MSQLVTQLRTLADRLEDGEYVTPEVSVSYPGQGENGELTVELQTREDFERAHAVLEEDGMFHGA